MLNSARLPCACAAFAIFSAAACGGAARPAPRDAVPAGASGGGAARATPQTGAVTSLTEKSGSETLSIEEYLRGRVPGLQVIANGNGRFTLRLRGANLSLVGGREIQPLVVIDGMPVAAEQLSQVLRLLSPGDIRKIDVLRDVASTSVYGMRAASGVILIRTMR